MNELDSNNKDLMYKTYLFERKLLVDAFLGSSKSFDKAVLTLSAGAFGLSLAFIRQIAPDPKKITIFFLLIPAWICFCSSIISTLISFFTSQSGYYKEIEELTKRFSGNQSSQEKKANIKIKSFIWTKFLNRLSLGAFILGVLLLASFSIANLLL